MTGSGVHHHWQESAAALTHGACHVAVIAEPATGRPPCGAEMGNVIRGPPYPVSVSDHGMWSGVV